MPRVKVLNFPLLILLCQATVSAAVINMEFTPKHIYAAMDNQIEIDLKIETDDGDGLLRKKLYISTSQGILSDVYELGEGKYRTTLTVPAQAPPRLPGYVLVLASVGVEKDTPVVGVRIPVYSTLYIKGRSAGGAEVYARNSVRSLGRETVADENGAFILAIPVMPGQKSVEIVGRKGDVEKINRVPLKIPPRVWFSVLTLPEVLMPGGTPGTIYIYALDKNDQFLTDPRFELDCTPGICSKTEMLKPGLFRMSYRPHDRAGGKEADIRVKYDGLMRLVRFKLASP